MRTWSPSRLPCRPAADPGPDRQFQKIITEGALRWHVGSPQIMAAQLAHLIEASHRPNVRLGIIPWTTPVHSPALHCFTIFDDRAVIVGTETATAVITDPADIADYEQRHALYTQLTVVGDPARAVLARLAAEYPDLSPNSTTTPNSPGTRNGA